MLGSEWAEIASAAPLRAAPFPVHRRPRSAARGAGGRSTSPRARARGRARSTTRADQSIGCSSNGRVARASSAPEPAEAAGARHAAGDVAGDWPDRANRPDAQSARHGARGCAAPCPARQASAGLRSRQPPSHERPGSERRPARYADRSDHRSAQARNPPSRGDAAIRAPGLRRLPRNPSRDTPQPTACATLRASAARRSRRPGARTRPESAPPPRSSRDRSARRSDRAQSPHEPSAAATPAPHANRERCDRRCPTPATERQHREPAAFRHANGLLHRG